MQFPFIRIEMPRLFALSAIVSNISQKKLNVHVMQTLKRSTKK